MSPNVMTRAWAGVVETMKDRSPRGDLAVNLLVGLKWGSDAEASLAKVRDHVIQDAKDAADWYRKARRWKRRISTSVRLVGIAAVSIAGLIPLMATLPAPTWAPWLAGMDNSIWISLLLGLAAALYGFDRFWGSTTGWVRCIVTEQKLRDSIEAFELEWERQRVSWNGQPPTLEQVDTALQKAQAFAERVNATVTDETTQWVDEFLSSYKQLSDVVKAKEAEAQKRRDAAKSPGAVLVKVTNAASADAGTVKLEVDGGAARKVSGSNIAVEDVSAGKHKFRVAAKINGKAAQAEETIDVPTGRIAALELTLK